MNRHYRSAGSRTMSDVIDGWFGYRSHTTWAGEQLPDDGTPVDVACMIPGRTFGRWRWWRGGVLALEKTRGSWRPAPALARSGFEFVKPVFRASMPIAATDLNVKRGLFVKVACEEAVTGEELELAVPTEDLPLLRSWFEGFGGT